jgi:hypothetical protein
MARNGNPAIVRLRPKRGTHGLHPLPAWGAAAFSDIVDDPQAARHSDGIPKVVGAKVMRTDLRCLEAAGPRLSPLEVGSNPLRDLATFGVAWLIRPSRVNTKKAVVHAAGMDMKV